VAVRTAVLVKELRAVLDGLLEQKALQPSMDLAVEGGGIIDAIVRLLEDEEAAQKWDRT
jgi:hypothetical protein